MEVCKGINIINVDNKRLSELKRQNNNFDDGVIAVLESLDFLIDDLVDRYEYESKVPYEKILTVVQTVIRGAYEREGVRNALITGLVTTDDEETPNEVKKEKVIKESTKQTEALAGRKPIVKEDVIEFGKGRTIQEIYTAFEFSNWSATYGYCKYHNVQFVKCKKTPANFERMKELLKIMSISEVAQVLGCSKVNVCKIAKKYSLEVGYKCGQKKKK